MKETAADGRILTLGHFPKGIIQRVNRWRRIFEHLTIPLKGIYNVTQCNCVRHAVNQLENHNIDHYPARFPQKNSCRTVLLGRCRSRALPEVIQNLLQNCYISMSIHSEPADQISENAPVCPAASANLMLPLFRL